MNEKIEKLKQKVAINNLFKNCTEADLVDIKDLDDLKNRQINDFLMKRETYQQCLFCTSEFTNLNQWISNKLKLINISNNIIIHILRSDKWMAEIGKYY